MNLSEKLLIIAEDDLQAAKCLYNSELYPQAVYNLQQAIEKITKAFGSVGLEMTQETMKKEIGHLPQNMLILMLQRYEALFTSTNQTSVDVGNIIKNQIAVNSSDAAKQLKNIVKRLISIKGIWYIFLSQQMPAVLQQVRNTNSIIEMDTDINNFLIQFENYIKENLNMVDENSMNELLSMLKNTFQSIVSMINPLVFLILIQPQGCEQNTRYPIQDKIPRQIYNKNHPLIKSIDSIVEIGQYTIIHLSKLIDTFQKLENFSNQIKGSFEKIATKE